MLDDFSLLSSTFCILYVFWRAAMLDKLPWFERESDRKTVSPGGDRKKLKVSSRGDADVLHRYYPWR